jgi:hypothetical protein
MKPFSDTAVGTKLGSNGRSLQKTVYRGERQLPAVR